MERGFGGFNGFTQIFFDIRLIKYLDFIVFKNLIGLISKTFKYIKNPRSSVQSAKSAFYQIYVEYNRIDR